MKKIHLVKLLLVGSLTFGLSGCFSHGLLNDKFGSVMQENEETYIIQQDNVQSFIVDKTNGRLMMVGEQYLYLFDETDNTNAIKGILQYSQLDPARLKVAGNNYDNISGLAVKVKPESNQFIFSVKVEYHYRNDQERDYFAKHGFNISPTTNLAFLITNAGIPIEGGILTGTLYRKSAEAKALLAQSSKQPQQMHQTFPITLYGVNTNKKVSASSLMGHMVLLPFTLTADIITMPAQLLIKEAFKDFKP